MSIQAENRHSATPNLWVSRYPGEPYGADRI